MKHHYKSIGLIISKKNDNFIFEYVNDDGVYLISYDQLSSQHNQVLLQYWHENFVCQPNR